MEIQHLRISGRRAGFQGIDHTVTVTIDGMIRVADFQRVDNAVAVAVTAWNGRIQAQGQRGAVAQAIGIAVDQRRCAGGYDDGQ